MIPSVTTVTLLQQPLPPRNLASSIVQINQFDGGRIHLTLVAQDATDPVDGPIPNLEQVVLYANPRGGHATGTFIVNCTLLQAHQMAVFGMSRLKQYTIPPRGSFAPRS